MIDLSSVLAIANFLIIIAGIGGGWLMLRSSVAKAETEVQARVREALHEENELLRNRVLRLEAENKHQGRLIQLMITTLKKLHGIEMDIDDDIITFRSPNGNVSRVSTDV